MAFIMKTIEEEFGKIHVGILFACFCIYIFCQKLKDNHASKKNGAKFE